LRRAVGEVERASGDRGFAGAGEQLVECAEFFVVEVAELGAVGVVDGRVEFAEHVFALLGEEDEDGAAVVWVAFAADEVHAFQTVDETRDVGGADDHVGGDFGAGSAAVFAGFGVAEVGAEFPASEDSEDVVRGLGEAVLLEDAHGVLFEDGACAGEVEVDLLLERVEGALFIEFFPEGRGHRAPFNKSAGRHASSWAPLAKWGCAGALC